MHPVRTTAVFVALLLALGACADSDLPGDRPLEIAGDTLPPEAVRDYLASALGAAGPGPVFCSYELLGQHAGEVYLWAVCRPFARGGGDALQEGPRVSLPVELEVDTVATPRRIVRHRLPAAGPEEGEAYAESVQEIFPPRVRERIFAPTSVYEQRVERLEARARRHAERTLGVAPPGERG